MKAVVAELIRAIPASLEAQELTADLQPKKLTPDEKKARRETIGNFITETVVPVVVKLAPIVFA